MMTLGQRYPRVGSHPAILAYLCFLAACLSSTAGLDVVSPEARAVAELLFASVRNGSAFDGRLRVPAALPFEAPPRGRLEEGSLGYSGDQSRRYLWAAGQGSLPPTPEEQAAADVALDAALVVPGGPRARRSLATGGRGAASKRTAAAAAAAESSGGGAGGAAAGDKGELLGFMPRWKQDMLKNKTKGQWQKWLNDQGKESDRKDPGYRGRGTEPSSDSGDVWKECGGMPKSSATLKHAPNLGTLPNFYVYTDKEFQYSDLLVCYKEKFGVNAWEDERMWELAQNTGALWLHASLMRHRSRVSRPEDAKLFVVPIDAYVSFKAGACGGMEHKDRMEAALAKLKKSHW